MSFVMAREQQQQILLALQADTIWKPGEMEVHLFVTDLAPSKATVEDDLEEPVGDWYAAIDSLDLTDPALDNDDEWSTVSKTTVEFVYSGTDDAETIRGYYLKGFDGKFIGAERFEEDQSMGKVGDSIRFTIELRPQLEGAAVVSP